MRHLGTWFMMFAFLVAYTLLSSASSYARDGFYIGSDMGLNVASSLDTVTTTNDLPSRCDQILFGTSALTGSQCVSGGSFSNSFSGATSFLAGAFAGYKYRDFRLELEYLYRNSNYDDESPMVGTNGQGLEKLSGEVSRAVERINQATSNNVFVNVYYDIPLKSRFSPYLGAGAGVSVTDFGYALTFTRNTDPNAINPANVPLGGDASSLAGTTSTLNTTLTDTMFTFQLLGGVDYWVSNNLALGLKGRWVWFDSFSDDGNVVDQLRSHVPNNGPGTETVVTNVNIDSFHMYGVTLSLKYMFGD